MAGQATCRGQAKPRMAGRNGLRLLESASYTMSSLFFPHKTLLCVLFAQLRQRKKMFSGRLGILGREARVAAPVDGAHSEVF